MTTPYIGEIMLFGGNFPPQGWAYCDGQLLQITQASALFALLGTTYGGDGRSTFGLPDLRGRIPVHMGTGPGLTPRAIGEQGGTEQVSLTSNQLPAHSHGLQVSSNEATTNAPAGAVLADTNVALYAAEAVGAVLSGAAVSAAGGGQSHDNMMPYQAVHFCISLAGIFPSRN
jgi:microcystin-dependent protein